MGFFSSLFGSYDLEDSIKKISTCDEIIVKDLSDTEYLKLLGKKSSIIEKKTINIFFQLNFEYDLMSKVLRIIKENSIIIQNQKLEIKTKNIY